MDNYRYDAHCHIFTLKYALKEVRNIPKAKIYLNNSLIEESIEKKILIPG
jgi:hypothetical protein